MQAHGAHPSAPASGQSQRTRMGEGSMTLVARAREKDFPSLTTSASTTSPATAPLTKTVLPSSVWAMASGP